MPDAGDGRLDSWKAIAEYLGRDVATVRRWEKALGLPVRRLPGGRRGHSVFAYTSEIDAWLRASPDPPDAAISAVGQRQTRSRWPVWVLVGTLLVAAAGALTWRPFTAQVSAADLRVEVSQAGVVARDLPGRLLWQHPFPASRMVHVAGPGRSSRILSTDPAGVLVWTLYSTGRTDHTNQSGEVMWFLPGGELARTFSFADRVAIGGKTFEPPWVLTDVAVHESSGRRRIAVASHHDMWSPSLVTVLDDQWMRRGTFFHDGWIEQVSWLTPDRLLLAGFSQERDAGMVQIMPVDGLDRGIPDTVVTMPRSEVNAAAGARFNRAVVQLLGARVVVRTVELMEDASQGAADIIYEFDEALTLLQASYSQRYWEAHQALEQRGKLTHPRDQCPDRAGPRPIFVSKSPGKWTAVAAR